ncbi:MAG: hypothetical protein NDI81_16880 [Desulfobacula sp.]|nr:hypothetical protein [Desulfobacula sp.]MDA8134909.1 hypothetical protein [Desulfobacteraceae bacterium]
MDETSQSDANTVKAKTSKWGKVITFLSFGGWLLILIIFCGIAIFMDNL